MQKTGFLFYLLVLCFSAWAQVDLDEIAGAEKKHFLRAHKSKQGGAADNSNVIYQRLELKANPRVNYIAGKIATYFIPASSISFVEFDLKDSLRVDSVIYHNTALSFSHAGDVLRCNLPSAIPSLQTDSIAVY